jgi:hypothetical protein
MILGFHSDDCEECRLLGCGTTWVLSEPTISKERVASIFRVERSSELGRLAVNIVPSSLIPSTLKMGQYVPLKHRLL